MAEGVLEDEDATSGSSKERAAQDPTFAKARRMGHAAAAFDLHATLPHTVRFLERITELSDQERDVKRTERIA